MRHGPNLNRRADLEAALKRAKDDDVISLQGLADLYSTSKQNFTNILRQIERMFDMPAYEPGPRGIHIYPAKKAISVIIAYEKRNDAQSATLQERTNRILGKGLRKKGAVDEQLLPINEMATLSRVMAETEQREREQGIYSSLEDQAVVAGDVFAMFSGYLSELDTHVDPNGVIPAEIRAMIRAGGKNLSLQIHAKMKHLLSRHASPKPTSAKRSRGKNDRPGRTSPRRPGGKRVARKARQPSTSS